MFFFTDSVVKNFILFGGCYKILVTVMEKRYAVINTPVIIALVNRNVIS